MRQLRRKPFSLLFILALTCGVMLRAGRVTINPTLQLYLLAGTTSQHTPQSYPVLLYRVGENKKLKIVREVVPQADGTRFMYAWGNIIFALHPHTAPTNVAIVHTNEPMRADDVQFSPEGVVPSTSVTTVAEPPGSGEVLLVPWITNLTDPSNPPAHYEVTDARISNSSIGTSPRVQYDIWSDYAYLRHQGAPGGPNYVPDLIGSAAGENLTIDFFGHSVKVDKLPPSWRRTDTRIVPIIAAASEKYLILTLQYPWESVRSGKVGDSLELAVRDRASGRWSTIRSEGNSPTLRLFGPWLATTVGFWSLNHGPNPGRENERSEAGATDILPPVQALYRSFKGRNISLPGILVLQNLADGRKIRIETGQEDSEILWAGDDRVLYRVNDAIYQAAIAGNQIQDPAVIVKDEDVPEIHWVFWAP